MPLTDGFKALSSKVCSKLAQAYRFSYVKHATQPSVAPNPSGVFRWSEHKGVPVLRIILKIAAGLVCLALGLGLVLVVNAVRFTPTAPPPVAKAVLAADMAQAARLLSESVQIETVSTDLTRPEFPKFVTFLQDAFPAVHAATDRQTFASNSLLFRWQGTDDKLPPALFAAHYDVVPVAQETIDEWQHPPFLGVQADGYVWGRGTMDNKGAVIAILTAAEHLIDQGFQPERTLYFAIGGDEEVGGAGAQSIRDHLTDQGITLAWVLDEGSMVFEGSRWRVDKPVASINVAEKGYLTVTLVARHEGGHSATPPRMTAAGRIARAVDRVQSARFDGKMDGVVLAQFREIGPHYALRERLLLANLWLLKPIFEGILSGSTGSDAMLRTTIAPTMLTGSPKDNVLPAQATATINFRIHPRDTIAGVLAHLTEAIDDPEVEIVVDQTTAIEASAVSGTDTKGYADISETLRAVFGEIIVAPGLSLGATDARFYGQAAEAAYRINPFLLSDEEATGFHGPNERLALQNLEDAVTFYGTLMQKQ